MYKKLDKKGNNKYLDAALDLYKRHIISSRMAAKMGGVSHITILKMAKSKDDEKEGK